MTIDDRTPRHALPLPHEGNSQRVDIGRLRQALALVDALLSAAHLSGPGVLLGRVSAGAGPAEEIACSAAGRALLGAIDAAAQRVLLGAITGADVDARITTLLGAAPAALDTLAELATALGNDADFAATITAALAGKQPLHTVLTALAAVSPVADRIAYFTGAATAATTSLTTTGRSLIGASNVAAVLALLSLASAAKTDMAQTFVGGQRANVEVLGNQATAVTFNFASANQHSVTLTGNATWAAPANLAGAAGQSGFVWVSQDTIGSRIPPMNGAWVGAGTFSTAANTRDLVWYAVDPAAAKVAWGIAIKGV